jgi:hypothetical protein
MTGLRATDHFLTQSLWSSCSVRVYRRLAFRTDPATLRSGTCTGSPRTIFFGLFFYFVPSLGGPVDDVTLRRRLAQRGGPATSTIGVVRSRRTLRLPSAWPSMNQPALLFFRMLPRGGYHQRRAPRQGADGFGRRSSCADAERPFSSVSVLALCCVCATTRRVVTDAAAGRRDGLGGIAYLRLLRMRGLAGCFGRAAHSVSRRKTGDGTGDFAVIVSRLQAGEM